jgi:nucleotide-binding universal stress UspA family protein
MNQIEPSRWLSATPMRAHFGGDRMNLLRLKVVLAAVDRDDASLAVLNAARTLADAGGATLHVVHVTPSQMSSGVATDGGNDIMSSMLDRARVQIDRAQMHVISGEPAHVIRMLSDRIRADVIVLGPHRETHERERRLGGTALAIATSAWAPCLIVKREIRVPLERVLVPVDLSDTARGALMVALSWSSALRAGTGTSVGSATTELTAMYVDRSERAKERGAGAIPELDAELNRVRAEAGRWAGVDIQSVTVAGSDVADAIADRARDGAADLIVLGTRGQGLDAVGRLGSVSDAVIRSVDAPVLLVPPAVWASFAEQHR